MTIEKGQTSLTYSGAYYKFPPEVKELLDLMCNFSSKEVTYYLRIEAIRKATAEVRLLKGLVTEVRVKSGVYYERDH